MEDINGDEFGDKWSILIARNIINLATINSNIVECVSFCMSIIMMTISISLLLHSNDIHRETFSLLCPNEMQDFLSCVFS